MFRSLFAALILVLAFALPVHAEGGVPCHGACTAAMRAENYPATVILVDNLTPPVSAQAPLSQLTHTAQALQDWFNAQVAPVWGLAPIVVTVLPRGAHNPAKRPNQWLLHLMNTSDVYGALGYHTVSSHGIPYGEIAVGDALAAGGNGGTYLTPNWTICASHELAELLVDPQANRVAWDGTSTGWIEEVGDPVQDQSYDFGDRGRLYRFTDFAYPAEFDAGASFPYDRLHLLHAPFTKTARGYMTPFSVSLIQTPQIYPTH